MEIRSGLKGRWSVAYEYVECSVIVSYEQLRYYSIASLKSCRAILLLVFQKADNNTFLSLIAGGFVYSDLVFCTSWSFLSI